MVYIYMMGGIFSKFKFHAFKQHFHKNAENPFGFPPGSVIFLYRS